MGIFGKVEVEYYQLTPIGTQRFQAGQIRYLGIAEQLVLKDLVKLGGTAELDELKMFGTYDSPQTLSVALRHLIDLGYVVPVGLQQPEVPGQPGMA